jgi:hypothetical protein
VLYQSPKSGDYSIPHQISNISMVDPVQDDSTLFQNHRISRTKSQCFFVVLQRYEALRKVSIRIEPQTVCLTSFQCPGIVDFSASAMRPLIKFGAACLDVKSLSMSAHILSALGILLSWIMKCNSANFSTPVSVDQELPWRMRFAIRLASFQH